MVKPAGKSYINTTLDSNVLRALKVLAANTDKRLNQLLEEAINDLLKKYEEEALKELDDILGSPDEMPITSAEDESDDIEEDLDALDDLFALMSDQDD